MKTGLRLQILLLIGALLTLAFLPLYFAMTTYTDVALTRSRVQAAERLATASANWFAREEAAPGGGPRALARQLGADAVGVYAVDSEKLVARYGVESAQAALPANWNGRPRPRAGHSPWAVGRAENAERRVLALVDPLTDDSAALRRSLGLYMALIGGALLVAVYFTVTAWIIRPLDQLSRAAKLVGSATHRLQLPNTRSAEFTLLAENLRGMTDKLADEQKSLVQKVEELQQARSQLEQAQAHLVRSERLASVGQLAAGLAHEVGNPIAALQGMQDLMLSGDLEPEEQLDFTRRMRKETERISRIIRDLLDFARPASSGVGSAEPGHVETAIHETVALVTHQPALRDVDLALDVHPDLPKVTLSNNHLTQVLLNLILNAAAACKGGGHIEIVARKLEKGVEISVSDDGPGVPEDMRERIFEPFVSTKDVGEGSGLGLSVCRGLVEAAGGKVWLDAGTERGARFVVSLVSC